MQDQPFYLPPQASTNASDVDELIKFILSTSIYLFLFVTVISLYFLWRFRRGKKVTFTSGIASNVRLEILWTVIPTILVFIVFYWGFTSFLKLYVVPEKSLEIKVTGKKWLWSIDYPNGVNTVNEFVIPVDKPIKVLISSEDVIHSFYIPAFRIKQDAVPNRYTVVTFQAKDVGEYDLFCAEYCGKGHADMIGKVRVLSEPDYEKWLQSAGGAETLSPVELGKKLYTQKACNTCHSIDGSVGFGPTMKGFYGRPAKLTDGSTVEADENYLRESILEPSAKIAEGYKPNMPTYQGILKSKDVDAIIAYIKTLK